MDPGMRAIIAEIDPRTVQTTPFCQKTAFSALQ